MKTLQLPLAGLVWANLVANIGIVVTGGAVRLTGSGLGCPEWPRCTPESWVATQEMGLHGAVEFGNRLLTFVLIAIAVGCWLAVLQRMRADGRGADRLPFVLATVIALGIPVQALIGGITVWTNLNPWIVALHLLVSMAMIALCVTLLDRVVAGRRPAAGRRTRHLGLAVFAVGWVVLYLGTVVTGSGPHAGDADSPRNNLDPQVWSHLHAASVWLLVVLTVALLVAVLRTGHAPLVAPVVTLLAIEVSQGVIGYVQYFTGLPILLVGIHLLGAAITSAALAWVVLRSRAHAIV